MALAQYAEHLAASGISVATAEMVGVYAVDTPVARSLGFVGNGYDHADLAGLAFPYRHPRTRALLVTRLRLDVPVNGRKYLAPTGSRNHLYLPNPLSQQLDDIRFDVLVTEGEKKALALLEAVGTKYLVVSVSGVWNWRTSDKEKRPLAEHPGTRTVRTNSRPIEDLDWITWRGRRVFILFDSDGQTNAQVQAAEQALAAELRKRAAKPLVVSLPSAKAGGKQGIDDILAKLDPAHRLARLNELLRGAAPRRKLISGTADGLDLTYEPSAGFMRQFDEYVDIATDAPAVYRPFTALAILAAVIGRKVDVPCGALPLSLNLFTCILGGSSYLHKTTLISIGKRLISAVKPDILLPDDFTPERLIDVLQKSPQAFLAWPEFAGFLARSGRDYQAGSRELLMELYDAPDEFRRELKTQTIRVERPSLTILAASATSWLSDQLRAGDLRSGFLNRFCFVLAETKSKSYPIPERPEMRLQNGLVSSLGRLAAVTGQADLSHINARYAAWYRDVEREAQRAEQVEIVSAFYTRLSVTALKFAVLLELAQSRQLVVSSGALEEALVLVDYLRAVIRHLLRVEFAPTQAAKKAQRVLKVIADEPGVKRGRMLKRIGLDAQELTRVLGTLREQGDVYEADGGWWASR